MSAETPKFEQNAESYEPERKYIEQLDSFIKWLEIFYKKHASGEQSRESLAPNSRIEDLIEVIGKNSDLAFARGSYGEAKGLANLKEKLKNPSFIPPEPQTIQELFEALKWQLKDAKEKFAAQKKSGVRRQPHQPHPEVEEKPEFGGNEEDERDQT